MQTPQRRIGCSLMHDAASPRLGASYTITTAPAVKMISGILLRDNQCRTALIRSFRASSGEPTCVSEISKFISPAMSDFVWNARHITQSPDDMSALGDERRPKFGGPVVSYAGILYALEMDDELDALRMHKLGLIVRMLATFPGDSEGPGGAEVIIFTNQDPNIVARLMREYSLKPVEGAPYIFRRELADVEGQVQERAACLTVVALQGTSDSGFWCGMSDREFLANIFRSESEVDANHPPEMTRAWPDKVTLCSQQQSLLDYIVRVCAVQSTNSSCPFSPYG